MRPFLKGPLTAQVARRAPRAHYPAPYAIIDLWARYGAHGSAAFEGEARSMARLFLSDTSRNLVRVFLLQDRLKAGGGKSAGELRHVHVIGAGVMGGDIAAWSALRGFTVTLQDRSAELIEPALKRARELFDKRLKEPALNAAALARLRADVGGAGVAEADVVIEAIFENLEAKQALYASIEPQLKEHRAPGDQHLEHRARATRRAAGEPGAPGGPALFNPVAQMPLIEVVHAAGTDPTALNTASAFARRIDKLPLPCKSAPGFMVNRVLTPYMYEAMLAAQEGVPLETIDRAAVDFGMPVGPIELIDVVGLDVAAHVGEIIAAELKRPVTQIAHLTELIAAKRLGRKSGAGFYEWREGKAVKARETPPPPEDLTDRLILVLVNECVACLREGVVGDAALADDAVIFGAGFAPFRGGPLTYARARGTGDVLARLRELASRHGARFAPDAGWSALSDGGKA